MIGMFDRDRYVTHITACRWTFTTINQRGEKFYVFGVVFGPLSRPLVLGANTDRFQQLSLVLYSSFDLTCSRVPFGITCVT